MGIKKVKVLVRDKNTLVLAEDANQGDLIDLLELSEIVIYINETINT